jgi:hypothetical protein
VDEHGAVGLHDEKSGGEGKMSAEAAGVVDGTAGYDESHRSTIPGCVIYNDARILVRR